jgi:hypothetical protein
VNGERSRRELGLPHLLLLPLVPLVPPFLSGILRAGFAEPLLTRAPIVDLPLSTSLAAGSLVAAIGLGLFLSVRRWRPPGRTALTGIGVLLVVGLLLTWWCLYNTWFEGLVTVGGGDVGPHLIIRELFVGSPQVPKGAVTFYAVTYWAERAFGLDAFGSIRLAFYLTVAVVLLATASAAAEAGARAGLRRWALFWLVFLAASQIVLLPLLHYLQADGFYSQLFALIPLFGCWAAYGLATHWAARAVIIVAWVVFTRYTYGLNGGDVLLAAAILAFLETRSGGTRLQRAAGWTLALLCLAALPVAYLQLLKYWNDAGKVVRPLIVPLLAGEALLTAALGVLPLVATRIGAARGDGELRLARFACAVGAVNLAPPLIYALTGRELPYYLLKYSFGAVALLASAGVVSLGFMVPEVVDRLLRGPDGSARRAAALAAVLPVALLLVGAGHQPYLRTYVERMRPAPPWKRIGPLADREGMERIAAVVRSEGRSFAGLLGSSWPLMHFENAVLGEPALSATRNWEELAKQAERPKPGCLFWYGGAEEQTRLALRSDPGAAQLRSRLAELDGSIDKRCETYPARWDPARTLQLCHRCDGSAPETGRAAGPSPQAARTGGAP